MIDRMIASSDFERILRTQLRARSARFGAHHLPLPAPAARSQGANEAVIPELSTADAPKGGAPVDDCGLAAPRWVLGIVVPKRHAKRSVSRNLVKRQLRAAMTRHVRTLPPGLWLLRLRAPLCVAGERSAATDKLRDGVRLELDQLLAQVAQAGAPRR